MEELFKQLNLEQLSGDLFKTAGVSLLRSGVKEVMNTVDLDDAIDKLINADPENDETVSNFFKFMDDMLPRIGLEDSIIHFMIKETEIAVRQDPELRRKLHGVLVRGATKWREEETRKKLLSEEG